MLATILIAALVSGPAPQPGDVYDESQVDWSPSNGISVNGNLIQACSRPAETNTKVCFISVFSNVQRKYDAWGRYTGEATYTHTFYIKAR